MDTRGGHCVKARRSELPCDAITVNHLNAVASLAAHGVDAARAACHLILSKLRDLDARVSSLSPLDGVSHLLSVSEFNHFGVSS